MLTVPVLLPPPRIVGAVNTVITAVTDRDGQHVIAVVVQLL